MARFTSSRFANIFLSPAIALSPTKMGQRYLKTEIETLKRMYPSTLKEDLLEAIPGREWTAICTYARGLGLHRSRKAIGVAVTEGLAKAKTEREEERGN